MDKTSQYGPPDRPCNYLPAAKTRMSPGNSSESESEGMAPPKNKSIKLIPDAHPEMIGRNVRMKFEVKPGVQSWLRGVIYSYNGLTGKYAVYFPCDKQTVETDLDDSDLDLL